MARTKWRSAPAAPLTAVLSFLRQEGDAYKLITSRAGEYAADWTVQSMPPAQHRVAAQNITALVAPGGTLLVLAIARDDGSEVKGPPWPLTRAEVEVFADADLVMRRLERIEGDVWWRAELSRGGARVGRSTPAVAESPTT